MRSLGKVLAVAAAAASVVGGAWLWWRWLMRRQVTWQKILSDNIPVHSAYWRARREVPGDILYVAIGDSAAQGIGASRPARGYVGVIAKKLAKMSGHSIRVVNLGISGATLQTALVKELPRLKRLNPDILTVAIGANDIAEWNPQRFGEQIELLFAQLPRHAIVADLPSFYFLPGERKAQQGNRMLRAAAARHGLRVVDLHEAMRREGMRGVVTQFAGDLFHPNDRGYAIWAGAFLPAVEDRLEQVLEAQASGSSDSSARSQSRASTNTSSA
ncbi:SGNH/GDSL hydrolase family protein [Gryllotalpicola ginsengisoli]|uniref:SGNH/GDSL hydrolase family protein n=1 Tax=Gryllotalpicola ginsengisoli TaxID=444608 RepID=UPI0003B6845A|nr:SGNH/GDSL hydrolase family protein [Gryllotalpicola ginsengisoli]